MHSKDSQEVPAAVSGVRRSRDDAEALRKVARAVIAMATRGVTPSSLTATTANDVPGDSETTETAS
ncbi:MULTISPECIES: hypothetical protein [unclassified Gordonia (in: high G+C Gram-positive bacteria)]|uniref:hypothetical protein n=1 Tax=unclassified Gordonia (in: high G+C Gram-positive bacteria) TaxID=2657482 RepID=UPI0008162850|nr:MULTISPECIES: hypothetical protein [unclassified Gordonia (in: high G+C Gram-positive bacteria)]SCC56085.1 hypothetical protein GA0061091_12722 [Gordonia sp. v-85]